MACTVIPAGGGITPKVLVGDDTKTYTFDGDNKVEGATGLIYTATQSCRLLLSDSGTDAVLRQHLTYKITDASGNTIITLSARAATGSGSNLYNFYVYTSHSKEIILRNIVSLPHYTIPMVYFDLNEDESVYVVYHIGYGVTTIKTRYSVISR